MQLRNLYSTGLIAVLRGLVSGMHDMLIGVYILETTIKNLDSVSTTCIITFT